MVWNWWPAFSSTSWKEKMNETEIKTPYNRSEDIREFEEGKRKVKEMFMQIRIQQFAAKGFIRTATKRMRANLPPKFPGKPLSEYLKEIRE